MITVYTSSTVAPQTSQDDYVIDLSGAGSLPTDVQLYAAAVDSENPSATFTFSWHLLRKPEGSSAALSDSQISNPVAESIDTWGNYLLFCIATNVDTGETSERDPLAAGNSAFLGVIVKSERLALIKPAPGERDWFNNYYGLVDAVENTLAADIEDHETRITTLEGATSISNLSELNDVVLSSASAGESLVYNGNEWVNQLISGGGGGASELGVIAGEDGGAVDLVTESLGFESDDNIVITGNTLTAGRYSVNLALAGTIDADTTGNAATATTSTTATRLATARTLSLAGPVTGSGDFDGSAALEITTSIGEGSISNGKLENSGIQFNNGVNSEVIPLGGQVGFEGTANEVEVSYNSTSNEFTFGLPSTINADTTGNAATATSATEADALSTARTIALTGSVSGSASFDGSSNISIDTALESVGFNVQVDAGDVFAIPPDGTFIFTSGTDIDLTYDDVAGSLTVALEPTISSDTTGNAATATSASTALEADSLSTARTVAITGGAVGSTTFDGSTDVSISTTLRTATGAARGGVLLDSGSGNSSAKILRREQQTVISHVDVSHYVASPTANNLTNHLGIDPESSLVTNLGLRSVVLMKNPFSAKTTHIDDISLVMGFGGYDGGTAGNYEFELVVYADLAAVLSNNETATGLTLSVTQPSDNSPSGVTVNYTSSYNGPLVPAGAYIGFKCINATKNIGSALHAQVTFSREIGV